MKSNFLLGAVLLGLFSCTDAPDSYDAKTTEAKDANESQAGEKMERQYS